MGPTTSNTLRTLQLCAEARGCQMLRDRVIQTESAGEQIQPQPPSHPSQLPSSSFTSRRFAFRPFKFATGIVPTAHLIQVVLAPYSDPCNDLTRALCQRYNAV